MIKGIFTILSFFCFYGLSAQHVPRDVISVFPEWYQAYLGKQDAGSRKDITIYNSRMSASRSWYGPSMYDMWNDGSPFRWINIDSVEYIYSASSKRQDYDTAFVLKLLAGVWQPFQLKYKRYDAFDNVLTYTEQLIVNGVAQNSKRIEFAYNTNGQILEELGKAWRNGIWMDSSRIVYVYDSQGRLLNRTSELKANSTWEFGYEYAYEYYKNTEMFVSESLTYIGSSGVMTTERKQYNYNSMDKMESLLVGFVWQGVLDSMGRKQFSYNNQGLLEILLTESYQNDRWRNDTKNTFVYDTDKLLIEKYTEHYYNNTWVTIRATYYEYNAIGLMEESISYHYDIWFDDTLELDKREFNNYDQAGNLLHHGEYSWLVNDWDMRKDEHYQYNSYNQVMQDSIRHGWNSNYPYEQPRLNKYYYETYEDGVWKEGEEMPSNAYPTPSNGVVTITIEALIVGKHTFMVFDYCGKKVFERDYTWSKGEQHVVFDGSHLGVGTYIYKIESTYGYADGKIVIQ